MYLCKKKNLLVGLINRDHRRYATTIYQRQSYNRREGTVAAVSVGSVIISRPLGAVGVEWVKRERETGSRELSKESGEVKASLKDRSLLTSISHEEMRRKESGNIIYLVLAPWECLTRHSGEEQAAYSVSTFLHRLPGPTPRPIRMYT